MGTQAVIQRLSRAKSMSAERLGIEILPRVDTAGAIFRIAIQ